MIVYDTNFMFFLAFIPARLMQHRKAHALYSRINHGDIHLTTT
jgi:predicted nucleic acid-binding protein